MTNTTTVLALLWQAITPLHPGTGQVSSSVIDLPVARERATGYPMVPASSIKGVLRDGEGLRATDRETVHAAETPLTDAERFYGYADRRVTRSQQDASATVSESAAGDLTFTDARLLALSVRSYRGTFALVTCPLILQRLHRDRVTLGLPGLPDLAALTAPSGNTRDLAADMLTQMNPKLAVPAKPVAGPVIRALVTGTELTYQDHVLFEDLDLPAEISPAARAIANTLAGPLDLAERESFVSRFAVVPDDVFSFLSETATEVTAHVRLDPDRKTVEKGALWYEESVPAEALFTSFLLSRSSSGLEVLKQRPYLQLGGKASVGRGLMRVFVGDTQ